MLQRGQCGVLGQGWMTGHQKSSDAPKRHGVLHTVPDGRGEGEIIGRRYMPRRARRQSRRASKMPGGSANRPKRLSGGQFKNGPKASRAAHTRQTAEQRNLRETEQNQRRCDQHEQHVLDHVNGQQKVCESIQGEAMASQNDASPASRHPSRQVGSKVERSGRSAIHPLM